MAMDKAIRSFAEQFRFEPDIINAEAIKPFRKVVVFGMGGSRLPAQLLANIGISLPVILHNDYGLPVIPKGEQMETLFIGSSYSGNTEETLDGFERAHAAGYNIAAIAVGGALIEKAKEYGAPYIQLPDTGIQPRSALGLSITALLALLATGASGVQAEAAALVQELAALATTLSPDEYEARGTEIAEAIEGRVPVIYASRHNSAIAYNWKIKFNETGKIPAFYNELPEVNHNEMTGFDVIAETKALSQPFHFIFISDRNDHPHIQKRMEVLEKQYTDRGLPVLRYEMRGENPVHALFVCLLTADWAAYHTAVLYGTEAEQVPMVEEFKRLIA